jgi:hypothetical protein
MWRKLVQSTYRRKSLERDPNAPFLPLGNQRIVFFLGALAQVWGGIEEALDSWVETIHENGGAEQIQSNLPPNLDRELDYLTDALKIGLMAADIRSQAAELIQQTHQIKGFRHTFIHGLLLDVSDDGKRVVIEHSRVRGAKRIRITVTFAAAQLMRHYAKASRLRADLRFFIFGENEE